MKSGERCGARAIVVAVVVAAVAAGCKERGAERASTASAGLPASTTGGAQPAGFRLRGPFFELPLPAGWGAHPGQSPTDEPGAVSGRYELIVATQLADLAQVKALGLSFEDAVGELAEVRRKASMEYAADPQHVENVQALAIGDLPARLFRARLSRPPLAGVTQLTIVLGMPAGAGSTSERPVLTFSLYDHAGGTPDALLAFAKDLLKPLQLRTPSR